MLNDQQNSMRSKVTNSYLLALWLISVTTFLANDAWATNSDHWSEYIAVPDGIRLAVDVWLPTNYTPQQKLPTIIYATRYWRSKSFANGQKQRNEAIAIFNAKGFAFVTVDVRGTGASFGSRDGEFTVAETNDLYHLIDWVIAQPWSNQVVGATGVSYTANTAENASFTLHPALKVVSPRFSDFDWYSSLVFPGGIPNKIISSAWGSYVWALDMNDNTIFSVPKAAEQRVLGVSPVDGPEGFSLLQQAVKEHRANAHVSQTLANIKFRDDLPEARSLSDPSHYTVTPYRFQHVLEQSPAAVFHWGSWMDSGTAAGVLARFTSFKGTGKFIIGPWNHGAYKDANPFAFKDKSVSPSRSEQYKKIANYFALMMNNENANGDLQKELHYFTMGSDEWKITSIWPLKNTIFKRFYLNENLTLTTVPPQNQAGFDHYRVNFNAGTGKETRWSTQLGSTDVYYADRAKADELLLHYTSAPLATETEITGTPVITLEVASTHNDGVLLAYLEIVSPEGEVTMLTEGGLRLIHRKVSENKRTFETFGPFHSFLREDAHPMQPNKVEKVTFALLPTSVVIPAGFSLRLAIAGHDKDTFIRVPETETPTLRVERNKTNISFISLPVIN